MLDEVEAKVRAAYGLDSGLPSGDPEGAQAEVPRRGMTENNYGV